MSRHERNLHRMSEPKLHHTLTPRIETRGALTIAGSQRNYTSANMHEIKAQWQALPFDKIPSQVGRAGYAVISRTNGQTGFEYLAGVQVSSSAGLAAGLVTTQLPARTWAVFPHMQNVSQLKNTITEIFHVWLPDSGRTIDHPTPDSPDLIEYYAEDFDPQTGTGTMEIWVPVKP
jgi:AraC family transcriptional regulator